MNIHQIRKSIRAVFASIVLIAALAGTVHAQQSTTSSAPGGRGQRIIQYLNLSPQQQSQLRPIMRGSRQQISAIKNDPSLTPDQKRERLKEIRQQTKGQIGQILTPDQLDRLRQLRQQQRRQRQNPQ